MSVLSVNEINESRQGPIDEKSEREYTRVFAVTTSSATDGPIQVRQATGIPRIGDYYLTGSESDLGAWVRKVDPVATDNPKLWHVRIEYSSSVEEQEENPLDRPAEISWSFVQFTRQCDKDIDGNGIVNSAGDPYDPPPEIDDSRPVLSVTRNEAAYNPALAIDYQDAVNTDAFLGFAAGQAKVANITAVSQFENGVRFWRVSYEFHFRRELWTLPIADMGKRQKGANPDVNGQNNPEERYWIFTRDGSPVTQDVPLDGAGRAQRNPNNTTIITNEFTVYKPRPFSVFNF